MTTLSNPASLTPVRVRDTRTVRRVGAALLLPLGPLSIAVVRLILPYFTLDNSSTLVRKITAAPGRESAVLWLSFAMVFLLVPSVLAAGRVLIRRAPVLATMAVAMLVPGFVALLFAENDPTLRAIVGIDPTAATKVLDNFNSLPMLATADNLFVLFHIVGMILLGVAALRSRAIPAVAAWALIISQPLHVVFAIAVPNHALDGASWALTAIAFACLARVALRMTDDEWDLPPIGSGA